MTTEEEIINDVLQFMYNGNRECSFGELKIIPSDKLNRIKDKLIIENLIEKSPRQYTSYADNYILTNRAIKLILDYETYQRYLTHKQNEKQQPGIINITASNGSFVNLATGSNNTLIQNSGEIEKIYAELEALGISKSQVENLREIAEKEAKDNTPAQGKRKKIFGWLGSLTTDLIKKGLEDKIPTIITNIEKLIAQYTNT